MTSKKNEAVMSFLLNRRSMLAANLIDPGPSNQDIDTIISAGIRVPDHGKCSPWRVQILTKDGQSKLGILFGEIFKQNNVNEKSEKIRYWKNRPQSAPCLLVVTFYPVSEKLEKVPLNEQLLSCGAFCQNILNASHALGYYAQWLTEWPAYNFEVKEFLGHDKNIDIVGFIYIGSSSDLPKERKRVNVDEITSIFD